MISLVAIAAFAGGIFAGVVFAQASDAKRPEFAVASIKPNKTHCCASGGVGQADSSNHYVTLKMLIRTAYRVQEFQISGGPGWIGSVRFDVEAKADPPAADFDQSRLMLQSLLEDRFKLKLHRQTKNSPVYALVVAKGGPKIKLSADQASASDVNGPSAPGSPVPNHGAFRFGPGSMIGNAVPISTFTLFLSQRMDRIVIDKTNLIGRFDIRFEWTPGISENPMDYGGNKIPSADPSGPSIFTAIQETARIETRISQGPG